MLRATWYALHTRALQSCIWNVNKSKSLHPDSMSYLDLTCNVDAASQQTLMQARCLEWQALFRTADVQPDQLAVIYECECCILHLSHAKSALI